MSIHPPDEATAAEIAKFQVTWKQVAYERDGVRPPADEEQGWEPMTVFGTPIRGTFTLDPTKEPKTIDSTDTAGAYAGETSLAIYVLEGDRLVLCAADSGRPRPTSFETKAGEVLRAHVRVRGQ